MRHWLRLDAETHGLRLRVVVATNAPPFPPSTWKRDGLPVGVITAFRLPKGPPAVSFP